MTRDEVIEVMADGITKGSNPFRGERSHAKAALTALEAAGYAIVPVECTPEMGRVGSKALISEGWLQPGDEDTAHMEATCAYRAMLKAAKE